MKLAAITLDENGGSLAEKMRAGFPNLVESRSKRDGPLRDLFAKAFSDCDGIVCVMAVGIVVRMIAPHAQSKLVDPAVVVVDDAARWAVSLLSGHEGGANNLAYAVARLLGAEPVITTGSDTARRHTLGVGCRRGVTSAEVVSAVRETLAGAGLRPMDVRVAASATLKRDEEGLIAAFRELDIPLVFLPEERINSFDGPFEHSPVVERNVGLPAVAEPCALLAGRRTRLLVRKSRFPRVTVAIAVEE